MYTYTHTRYPISLVASQNFFLSGWNTERKKNSVSGEAVTAVAHTMVLE